jgi:hypothetical protein
VRSPKSNRDFLVVYLYIYGGWDVDFKTWDVIYNAKLVSTSYINVALIHEIIAKALRDNAGAIGYLVGQDSTDLINGGSNEQ